MQRMRRVFKKRDVSVYTSTLKQTTKPYSSSYRLAGRLEDGGVPWDDVDDIDSSPRLLLTTDEDDT
jgi:hypothetical protein